uniref:Uncharacterized protein n=1 Tax=Arundo donax TaxID=35708 RepID=A0A0A9DMB5_ARUDO
MTESSLQTQTRSQHHPTKLTLKFQTYLLTTHLPKTGDHQQRKKKHVKKHADLIVSTAVVSYR